MKPSTTIMLSMISKNNRKSKRMNGKSTKMKSRKRKSSLVKNTREKRKNGTLMITLHSWQDQFNLLFAWTQWAKIDASLKKKLTLPSELLKTTEISGLNLKPKTYSMMLKLNLSIKLMMLSIENITLLEMKQKLKNSFKKLSLLVRMSKLLKEKIHWLRLKKKRSQENQSSSLFAELSMPQRKQPFILDSLILTKEELQAKTKEFQVLCLASKVIKTKNPSMPMESTQRIFHHSPHSFQSNGFNVVKSSKHSILLSTRESSKVWFIFSNSILKTLFAREIPTNLVGRTQVSWLTQLMTRQSSKNLELTGLSEQKKTSTKSTKNFASLEITSMEWV